MKRRNRQPSPPDLDGHEAYPIAAIAYYGPDAALATKVVVAIIDQEHHIVHQRKWLAAAGDIRFDQAISHEMALYISGQGVKKVVIAEKLLGCPHEEGIDYPPGEKCPHCPYWQEVAEG